MTTQELNETVYNKLGRTTILIKNYCGSMGEASRILDYLHAHGYDYRLEYCQTPNAYSFSIWPCTDLKKVVGFTDPLASRAICEGFLKLT